MKPKARRTCTLIAKSLQTLANMASFGTKEHWMEPMNAFLGQHRESFKTFIDDVCYVPTPLSPSTASPTSPTSPTQNFDGAPVETHLSYTTPMTIMHRLPPTSREGFPSLPYLIDQARNFAELVQMWLETTSQYSEQHEISTGGRSRTNLLAEIQSSPDLRSFHDVCSLLHARTQECLSRAERAERPNSALSFRWDELIDQLEKPAEDDDSSFDKVADRIASDSTIAPPGHLEGLVSQLHPDTETDEDEAATRMYESTPPHSSINTLDNTPSHQTQEVPVYNKMRSSLRSDRKAENRRTQIIQPGRVSTDSHHNASASASASNVSSAVSSDTEYNTTTALPAYERHHVEITGGGNQRSGSVGFLQQRTDRKLREKVEKGDKGEKEKRRKGTILPAFNKKKKDKSGGYENGMPSPQS